MALYAMCVGLRNKMSIGDQQPIEDMGIGGIIDMVQEWVRFF